MHDDTIETEAKTTATRLTNVEFVTELMEFSKSGALAQVFIIDAIKNHADAVAKVDASAVEHPLISGQAWVNCAKEIKAHMDAHYGQ